MKRLTGWLAVVGVIFTSSAAVASAQTITSIDQKRAFGTIVRGATTCVGPLSPSSAEGVQISGFTNGNADLTWQVFSVSSQSAPVLVFSTTARTVSQTVPPSGNMLFHACVVKSNPGSEDFDLILNSQPLG